MFKLLKEIFRTGQATALYPFAPPQTIKDSRGKPEHDPVKCIACAACTGACPANALSMKTDVAAGTRTWAINYGQCVFCGRCQEVCPTNAIALTTEFELAVARKDDLITRATFKLAYCRTCGAAFSTLKEVDYVARLLGALAETPKEAERIRAHAEICPACKRRLDVEEMAQANPVRQMECL
ncbi:hydrogenase-4 component H [Rhodoblastus acidophilus]|uniref:formate hydrogenlyase complex iron-sulfur subunit n=1 Tax=Rhodoblastus acidophilus TaxID=1074 RepID=UPI002225B055|nr:formate hydrogenlyase complex iron-sulfur subunit [Rhodoblastus acidophilus]MCW2285406.1 hydrogenase-4 component H [Rhodoblastus acidophilus]MCW2334345.1 hydrogenase-4 component H [Rhodoblastus acidophilus]